MRTNTKKTITAIALLLCFCCYAGIMTACSTTDMTSADDVDIVSPSETTYPYRQENSFISRAPSLFSNTSHKASTPETTETIETIVTPETTEIVEPVVTPETTTTTENIETVETENEEEWSTPGVPLVWKVKKGNLLQVPSHSVPMQLPSQTAEYTIISQQWQQRCLLASIENDGRIDIYLADINGTLTLLNEGQTIVSYIVNFKELYWVNSEEQQWLVEWTEEVVQPEFYGFFFGK